MTLFREAVKIFVNKTENGRNNIVGTKVAEIRKGMKISQRELADRLVSAGLLVDKNAVQRMESGQRFVTDIALIYISKVPETSIYDLLGIEE